MGSNLKLAASTAIIDLDAYAHNLRVVRELAGPGAAVMAVVKANAYGHGLVPVGKKAAAYGAAMLGVAMVEEGVALREAGIRVPIAVLFQPDADALDAVVEHNLTLIVSDVATAEALGEVARRANRVVPVHCMLDTGMGRQGFDAATAETEILRVTRFSHIDIEGICTHFAQANKRDDEYTQNQIRVFRNVAKQLERGGIPFEKMHCCNSPGVVNYPKAAMDMVRAGLMTYGIWPVDDRPADNPLKPVLRWETSIAQVRDFPAGHSISYGRRYVTQAPMRAAIMPVGYADGFPYAASNEAHVLIQGKRCPVRGSICMDQTVVDISAVPSARQGDPCILLGEDRGERIGAEDLAAWARTIPYEILSNVGPRVERVYRGAI